MTGKRVMTRSKKEKELTSFKDENGEVYKTGGKKTHLCLLTRNIGSECVCVCVRAFLQRVDLKKSALCCLHVEREPLEVIQLLYSLLSDFAYVDSQQPDLPHHICVIRDFKLVSFPSISQSVSLFTLPSKTHHSDNVILMLLYMKENMVNFLTKCKHRQVSQCLF